MGCNDCKYFSTFHQVCCFDMKSNKRCEMYRKSNKEKKEREIASYYIKPQEPIVEVYGIRDTIDNILEKFSIDGKINGMIVDSKYYEAYKTMLWIKFLDSIDKEEVKKYNNKYSFDYMFNGRTNMFTSEVKELISILKNN